MGGLEGRVAIAGARPEAGQAGVERVDPTAAGGGIRRAALELLEVEEVVGVLVVESVTDAVAVAVGVEPVRPPVGQRVRGLLVLGGPPARGREAPVRLVVVREQVAVLVALVVREAAVAVQVDGVPRGGRGGRPQATAPIGGVGIDAGLAPSLYQSSASERPWRFQATCSSATVRLSPSKSTVASAKSGFG